MTHYVQAGFEVASWGLKGLSLCGTGEQNPDKTHTQCSVENMTVVQRSMEQQACDTAQQAPQLMFAILSLPGVWRDIYR